MHLAPRYRQRLFIAALILLGAALLIPKTASAITPKDPEVEKHVKRALGYLANARDDRVGGDCLIGLCFWKAGEPIEHPKIQFALTRCKGVTFNAIDNYSLGIALMFMCEVGPEQNHDLIDKFTQELFRRQKPHGGWGYDFRETGDTSQTQYAVLGMWMVKNFAPKIEVPIERIERVGGWLMRTQDPSGGWGYQGVDPGSLVKVAQSPVTDTLSASASGSMYMVADMLQVTQRVDAPHAQKSAALQDVPDPTKKSTARGPLTKDLNPDDIKNTLAAADKRMGNGFTEQGQWNHYYMYALERYHSFREKAGGGRDTKWYDQGYEHLHKSQMGEGNWPSAQASDNDVTATCFATLFLLRSSEKTIQKWTKLKMGEGLAKAGMYLPKDIRSIQVENGKVVDKKIVISTEQIMELVNKGENDEVARMAEQREALALSSNKTDRNRELEKLRNHVRAGDANVRMIVVRTLSKDRNLDNVPALIFALSDPAPAVATQADRGLRFISRKVNGVGLPAAEPTKAEIQLAERAWKAWYLSIRPNAELLD
jgi:hypothetical protein